MENKDINNKFRALVRQALQEGKLNEMFDDEEDMGIYGGDFNRDEFKGDAMRAAMSDMGDDFTPLGKSQFEKGMDPEEFMSDLERQNLNLPNDKAERDRLKKTMDTKNKHEKMFGSGSLNEGDEIKYRGVSIKVLHPSGYFEFYSDKEGRFLKFDDLDSAKGRIDSELSGSINEVSDDSELPQGDHPDGYSFDMKSLYNYLKDAFYSLKDYDEAVAAQILEKALKRDYGFTGNKIAENITPQDKEDMKNMSWGEYSANKMKQSDNYKQAHLNASQKNTVSRPKDSEGNDLKIGSIVKHLSSGQEGKILRFGTTENGQKLVAQIDWFSPVVPVQGTPQSLPGKNIEPTELVIRKETEL